MGKFGWSLPPGCSMRDIEDAFGEGSDSEEDSEPIGGLTPEGEFIEPWDERLRASGCTPVYKKPE